MTTYRRLTASEIDRALFAGFVRPQEVTRCWRKINGAWQIRDIAFVDDWSEEDYAFLVTCLQNTVCTGGAVFGAFADGVLKGFVSVESAPLGRNGDYRDLSSLHVSQELRGAGDRPAAVCARTGVRSGAGRAKALYFRPLGGRDAGVLPCDGLHRGAGV